jgi:hypothetical protein
MHGLAALGAACAKSADDDGGTGPDSTRVGAHMGDVLRDEDLYASSISIGDRTFYLASVGARVRSVKDTAAALSRILSPPDKPGYTPHTPLRPAR